MSHVFLDTRDGRLALYLNGDLQFDAADERLYHEPLALVPLALAARRVPGQALRVLVLGGGDGLALREVLRFPEVAEAHLVDHDPAVLRLGREALAGLNRQAFGDPRARAHVADAREFLRTARDFHVVISDLTYPRDVAGASLFSVPFFAMVRAALAPRGVLALNAVSPELTPEAFGCVAATLGAAALEAVPYAFALPSFQAEGYGRWGFLYASAEPIADDELGALALPTGTRLTTEALLAGSELPAGALERMRVAPNRTDELLYYLANSRPLEWAPPLRPLRFAAPPSASGPRLTVAHGFAAWLRQPSGGRSLDELLACLPLSQRGQTRELVLEWSHHAELLFREVDLSAFLERALRHAATLPQAWLRELRELAERIRDGLPPLRELLYPAYRVFAVFLLVLLVANLFFPDNLYAKGGSARGGSSGIHTLAGGSGFHFTQPGPSPSFRSRSYSGVRSYGPYSRTVRNAQGAEFDAQPFLFSDPGAGLKPIPALLVLTPDLRLLDNGTLAYAVSVPGYQFLLEPGRLAVLDVAGNELLALHPGTLGSAAARSLEGHAPLLDKAIADHRRWLEWTRWGSMLPPGHEASSELGELERIQRAFAAALGTWRSAAAPADFAPATGWKPVFPGIFAEAPGTPDAAAILVSPLGTSRLIPLGPPAELRDDARLLYWILYQRVWVGGDRSFRPVVERWERRHGSALGIKPVPMPGRRRS